MAHVPLAGFVLRFRPGACPRGDGKRLHKAAKDLAPLSSAAGLWYLNLDFTRAVDLTPEIVRRWPGLRHLSLRGVDLPTGLAKKLEAAAPGLLINQ